MLYKTTVCLLFVSLLVFSTCSAEQNNDDEYDVPYVPTVKRVVDQMLQMANVSSDDILYDLGCGDGRIVITAAKKFGTRGVGIDLNPVRIEESNENAKKAGVTDRVKFSVQNLFDVDLSEATVVTLYLLPSVNIRLRPKLFLECAPGTRVVSHNYDMDEWDSDNYMEINDIVEDRHFKMHTIFSWVIPVNISGTWEWTLPHDNADAKQFTLQVVQKFQKVRGKLISNGSVSLFDNAALKGNKLLFEIKEPNGGQSTSRFYSGEVNGNVIEGTVISIDKTNRIEQKWVARRDPSTVVPLMESEVDE